MAGFSRLIAAVLLMHCAAGGLAQMAAPTTAPVPRLTAGSVSRISFPDMPPTYAELATHSDTKPMMSIFLPRNYTPEKKFPLLVFLGGGDGGTGSYPGIACKLTEEKDFVCVSIPLFKEKLDPPVPGNGTQRILIRNPDCRYGWPYYKRMLEQLEIAVPNIDPEHRILGGFSNGAHATSGLIDDSDGEIARMFSAFFFIEGGGKLQRYDLLKGKQFLMVYGSEQSRLRAQQIADAAKAAGAEVAIYGMHNVGHAFPESEYPAVRDWLHTIASR